MEIEFGLEKWIGVNQKWMIDTKMYLMLSCGPHNLLRMLDNFLFSDRFHCK